MPVTPMFRPIRAIPTSVPFTYRDGITTLELIELLRHNLNVLQAYVNQVKEWAETENDKTDTEISEINERLTSIDIQIEDILSKFGNLDITNDVYDVTQGRYVNSADAMRNMYRELAVFGARVDQMATMTTAQAAQHDCITWSVIGNREIFGNQEPRVTPRERTGQQ